MKTLAILVVTFSIFLSTGCSTLPSPEEMKVEAASFELPKLPEMGKAIVYVVRPASLGALIRFNVFVDDKLPESEMGYTRGSQYIYFNLEPGSHQILSKAENWAETNVETSAGDVVFIQQEPSMGIFLARNSLLRLQGYEGRYHVKHLGLGTIKKVDK